MKFDFKKFRTYLIVVIATLLFAWIVDRVFFGKKERQPNSSYEKLLERENKRLRQDSIASRERIKDIVDRAMREREKLEEKVDRYIQANENLDYKNYSDAELDSARAAILSKY